jgi:hypothetical protein
MYFLRASLSVIVLSFFLGATYAQDYDPESSSIIPTTTAPPHATITNQAPCGLTEGNTVFGVCDELSTTPETHTLLQPKCLVTINSHVFDTCSLVMTTIGDSQITMAPRYNPSTMPEEVNCITTKSGLIIYDCEAAFILPTEELSDYRQVNAACLTTLTAREGHVVIVDCGDGFESGYPPTTTSPSFRPAKPTTVCIEDRCFDVVGTFGSPASATATPTQTQSKDEL